MAACCNTRCRTWNRLGRVQLVLFLLVLILFSLYIAGNLDYIRRLQRKASLSRGGKRNETLWLIPSLDAVMTVGAQTTPPDNWTFLSPAGLPLNEQAKCQNCMDDSNLMDLVEQWNSEIGPHFTGSQTLKNKLHKMSRALYAIERGAVGVTLTSDLLSFDAARKRLILDKEPDGVKGIEYYGMEMTLDSYHFIHRSKMTSANPCVYRIRTSMKPAITVGLRCRQTPPTELKTQNKSSTEAQSGSMSFLIDDQAPPIFTPIIRFSVVDFSDSFFDYEGLWAMFVSVVAKGESAEAWSVWMQRMMQEIGAELALTSLPCPARAAMTTVTSDQPSKLSKGVHKMSSSWYCPKKVSFSQCGILLAEFILSGGYFDPEDVRLLRLWYEQLKEIGYPEPVRKPIFPRLDDMVLGCVIHNPARVVRLLNSAGKSQDPGARELFPAIKPQCAHINMSAEAIDPFKPYVTTNVGHVKDIALIVIFFNSSIYNNVKYLEDLYRPYFKYLLYCGPDSNSFQLVYRTLTTPVSFIEVSNTNGFVAYECVTKAMMLNYDVRGYLEMADDVILNPWTLGSIPRDLFWFQKELHIASRMQQVLTDFAVDFPFPWWPWTVHGQMWGAKAMANVWKKLQLLRKSGSPAAKQIVNNFLVNLSLNSGHPENFFYSSSDIFYVPQIHRRAWTMLGNIFMTNNVFLDIAVPTLVHGLDAKGNVLRMQGEYLWYGNRINYAAHYRPDHQFFHPWKMGWMAKPKDAAFMCTRVLPEIVKDLTR